MAHRPRVAVIGLGAAGSAALLALARRGIPAVGLDRYRPPHSHGSSHGRSRVIREAYYESPAYVPLVRRAYELWQALERDGGRPLLQQTGGLMIGPADGALVRGARESAEAHGLPFELLDAAGIRRRFPVFHAPAGSAGVLEPRAGVLDPEAAIVVTLELAAQAGAELRFEAPVSGWREEAGGGLRLDTSAGPVHAERVIVTAGPWAPELLAGAGAPLEVERQVMYWFRPPRRNRSRQRGCRSSSGNGGRGGTSLASPIRAPGSRWPGITTARPSPPPRRAGRCSRRRSARCASSSAASSPTPMAPPPTPSPASTPTLPTTSSCTAPTPTARPPPMAPAARKYEAAEASPSTCRTPGLR